MNKQDLVAIGTVVKLLEAGMIYHFGMVADYENSKWGWVHIVLTQGKFEKVHNIEDENRKSLGWKVASAEELAFRAKYGD
jgi:hypothetical protein